MFALGTGSFVIAGILGQIAAELDASVAATGQMVTLYALSYALLSPLIAATTANWPPRRLLLSALAIFTLGNLLTAVATSLGMVLASRVIAGMGAAIYSPTATTAAAMLVPPAQRGRALSIVLAGLSGATALGAPIATALGGFGGWRVTMAFVTAVGATTALSIWRLLPVMASPPPMALRQRLAPLRDPRILPVILTTLVAYSGFFAVYTYIAPVFARATGGQANSLALLLMIWGVAATIGNLVAGALSDRFGTRWAINGTLAAGSLNFLLLHWSAASFPTAVAAVVVWGICGWGLHVPQQHRLIGLAPASAPVLLGLNTAAMYTGISVAAVTGGAVLARFGAIGIGFTAAVLVASGLLCAEWAAKRMSRTGPVVA
ncbi:MAG TPA: MFS transporter [Ramlibacter sp.]|nr:MFS transporter [Ramlibacter sp.]